MAFRARVSPDLGGDASSAAGPGAVVVSGLNLRTYKRAVYEALLEMIVSLELPPGERLVESDLAGRLGVSKTPVREALAMLESDGLVEATPYRGASVRWLSMNESMEQGYLVDALEMPAYPMVIERITKAELAVGGQGRRAAEAGPQGARPASVLALLGGQHPRAAVRVYRLSPPAGAHPPGAGARRPAL